jgi:hypothetical protein
MLHLSLRRLGLLAALPLAVWTAPAPAQAPPGDATAQTSAATPRC